MQVGGSGPLFHLFIVNTQAEPFPPSSEVRPKFSLTLFVGINWARGTLLIRFSHLKCGEMQGNARMRKYAEICGPYYLPTPMRKVRGGVFKSDQRGLQPAATKKRLQAGTRLLAEPPLGPGQRF